MPGVSRKTTDTAGGTITGGSSTVLVNGQGVVRLGDTVQSHGIGAHAGATMTGASGTVKVNSIRVVRAGDAASCGHTATGSSNVLAGG